MGRRQEVEPDTSRCSKFLGLHLQNPNSESITAVFRWIPTRAYCRAQGTLLSDMWQPGWERDVGENGHMDMHGGGPLLSP